MAETGRPSVLVIGGGFAGIAAATALADAGLAVTLVERRAMLGGRASSFVDAATGLTLDGCRHVTLGCCTNVTALLQRLGLGAQVDWHDAIPFRFGDGARWQLRATRGPAPLHLLGAFSRIPGLTGREKLATARVLVAILARGAHEADGEVALGPWLRDHGLPSSAAAALVGPVVSSACNETIDDVTLGAAAKVLRDGILASRGAGRLGLAREPMGSLLTPHVAAYLEARGGRLRSATTVRSIAPTPAGGWAAQLVGGASLECEWLVLAAPFDQSARLCAESGEPGRALSAGWRGLAWSPIVGVHLWFDRPCACPPALALPDARSQWLFQPPGPVGRLRGGGAYLTAAISADRSLVDLPADAIAAIVARDARAALPELSDARLLGYRVIKERKATVSAVPGSDAWRPPQRTTIRGLYLAGDWTRTGWPSTMEGAARGGLLAAEALLEDLGRPRSLRAPDLPPDWPARAAMAVGRIGSYLGSGSRSKMA